MIKRVLIVTYYFPPRPGVASSRLRGISKYLKEFGWEPVILTAKLPENPAPEDTVIQTLYPGDVTARWKARLGLKADKGFQEQIRIPRALREGKASLTTRAINLVRAVIAYPDEQIGWYPFAIRAGTELMKEKSFDAIISSSSPVTCHLIAQSLKAEFKVPWIADLRDLWTQNHYYPYIRARNFIEKHLEVKTLGDAEAIVTVSEPLAEKLQLLHLNRPVFAIPNGYDEDEVELAIPTKEFTITYTGELYQGKRDPSPLFQVIAELITEGRLNQQDVRVRFYGSNEYWVEREIKKFALEDVVRLHPRIPRNIALERQRNSQVLLLLNWDDPEEIGVYTGKLFEYLAARRPILAIGGPRGVVSELLEETRAGIHASGYEKLKQVFIELYEQYRILGYVPYKGREEHITKYSHREMARRFASLMEELCKGKFSMQC